MKTYMNKMKQTAVEWLINELKKSKHYQQMINEVHQNSTIVSDILEQAKEMEKEQLHAEYMDGWKDGLSKQGLPAPPLDRKIYK